MENKCNILLNIFSILVNIQDFFNRQFNFALVNDKSVNVWIEVQVFIL